MKKVLRSIFVFALCFSTFMGSYSISYGLVTGRIHFNLKRNINTSSVIAVDRVASLASKNMLDKVVAEEVSYENTEEATTSDESNYDYSGNYSNNYSYYSGISGNSISVGNGLYSSLMYDNGSNFYLDHDAYGNYDGRGVPYIDYRTNFYTRKTIVYAHSSPNGNGPFQALQNYHYNPGYYYNNRYITINYEGNTYTYEIFSVYVSVADNDYSDGLEYYYRTNYDDEDWAEAIQRYRNNSEYDTGVSVSSSDKILILQTCSMDPNYYERYYRYNLLVMGKLV